jgi:superfamily II RNA helicase
LDEFHYMGHVGRGGVWEESIIGTLPHRNTQMVALSATLSNAADLVAWMESVSSSWRGWSPCRRRRQ